MKAPNSKIGVTLYNLRDYCKTEKDLDETLRKVKEIGYQAVQVSGVGPIEPKVIKSLLDKYGLYCCATHENLDAYENNFEQIVDKMKTLECDFTAMGSPGQTFWSVEGTVDLAARLSKVADKFEKEGIIFGYHNHDAELMRLTNKTFLDEIFDNTGDNFFAEIDVHWIQRGGGDPVEWIRKMKGRTSVIHFKDYAMRFDGDSKSFPEFAEIGEGNLNWEEIIKACVDTDVRWYVVEQDTTRGDKDIFESIKISYDNMRAMGLE